jgi:glycosyltransferase involved in cell wall biosynthesis
MTNKEKTFLWRRAHDLEKQGLWQEAIEKLVELSYLAPSLNSVISHDIDRIRRRKTQNIFKYEAIDIYSINSASTVALGFAWSGPNKGGVRNYIEKIYRKSKFCITLYPDNEADKTASEWPRKKEWVTKEVIEKQQSIINCHDIFHSNVDPEFINLAAEAQRQGKKWVHTFHSYYKEEFETDNNLKQWQKEINEALFNIAKRADVCISVSQWLVDDLRDRNIKSILVPNFIDFDSLDKSDKNRFIEKYQIENFILFVGGADKNKNCIEFIRAAQITPNYKFVLIGTNLTKNFIETNYNITLPDNLHAIGPVSHAAALDALSACSMLVINSLNEGLPTVLLEAMALMKPCVIPSGPNWSKDLLTTEDEGYKYNLGDISELSQVINKIAPIHQQKHSARDYVIKNFSADVVIEKIDEIYEGLLSNNKNNKLILSYINSFNFIDELTQMLRKDYRVEVDEWGGNDEGARRRLIESADIIFCEWCAENAVWYSKNKKPHQKLFIRLHRYELYTTHFFNLVWENVTQIIFIAPEIRNFANERIRQYKYISEDNFDWKFYIENNDDLTTNVKDLESAWRDWQAKISRGKVGNFRISKSKVERNSDFVRLNNGALIFNYVKSSMFKSAEKSQHKFNIGLIGFLPKLKRLDVALDIIEFLIKRDNRFNLYILGKTHHEVEWIARNKEECAYFEAIHERIHDTELKDHVYFENFTPNPEVWLRKIGYILSVSDIEGSHQAVAESMATGTVPFIYGNALKKYGLDKIYPTKYCYYEENIENLCSRIMILSHDDVARQREMDYCKRFAQENFNLEKIYGAVRRVMEYYGCLEGCILPERVDKDIRLIYLSEISGGENIHQLIDEFRKISAARPELKLTICYESLEEEISLGQGVEEDTGRGVSGISLRRNLSRREICHEIAKSDIGVSFSRFPLNEGVGMLGVSSAFELYGLPFFDGNIWKLKYKDLRVIKNLSLPCEVKSRLLSYEKEEYAFPSTKFRRELKINFIIYTYTTFNMIGDTRKGNVENEINIMCNLVKMADVYYNDVYINDCVDKNNYLKLDLLNERLAIRLARGDPRYDGFEIFKPSIEYDAIFFRGDYRASSVALFNMLPDPKVYCNHYDRGVWGGNIVGFQTDISGFMAKAGLLGLIGDDNTLNYKEAMVVPSSTFIRYQFMKDINCYVNVVNLKGQLDSLFLIAIVGNINEYTSVYPFVDIFERLRERHEGLNISVIVMANEITEGYEDYSWIKLIKNLPNDEYMSVLRQCDVCINTWLLNTAIYSGSNKNLDAVSVGIPVIVPYSLSYAEIFGDDYPLYFSMEDRRQVEILLNKIIENEGGITQVIQKRYNFIRSKYNSQTLEKYYIQICELKDKSIKMKSH